MEGLEYKIKDKSDCIKEITVQLPWEQVSPQLEKVYADIRRQVQLPGFRKGKVPVDMVKERYGEEARQETVERISPEVLKEVLEKEKLYPAVTPSITDYDFEPSKPFKMSLQVEIMPEISPKKYKKLKLEKHIHKVSREDVEKTITSLKENNPRLESKEGPAEKGDYAIIEFTVSRQGRKIDLGSGNSRFLLMGENSFLPDFDKKISGMKKGDEREFDYTFPDSYDKQQLQGETAKFKVSLKELKSKTLVSDDEIAVSMGLKDASELRGKINESLENQLKSSSENHMENEIIKQILEGNKFEIPPGLVQKRASEMLKSMESYISNQGGDPSEIDRKQVEKRAEREIKAGIVLGAIAEKEGIEVSENDLKEKVEEIKKQIGTEDSEKAEKYVNRNAVLTEKVFEFIKENAKISEKEVKEKK